MLVDPNNISELSVKRYKEILPWIRDHPQSQNENYLGIYLSLKTCKQGLRVILTKQE